MFFYIYFDVLLPTDRIDHTNYRLYSEMSRLEFKKSLTNILNLSKTGIVCPSVFLSGSVGNGKSFMLKECLEETGVDFGIVRCGEIYSNRLFNATVVNAVQAATGSEASMKLVNVIYRTFIKKLNVIHNYTISNIDKERLPRNPRFSNMIISKIILTCPVEL